MYSGCGIEFDSRSEGSFTNDTVDETVNIFGVDMSSSVHIDSEGKDILIPGKGPRQGLDYTTLTTEGQY